MTYTEYLGETGLEQLDLAYERFEEDVDMYGVGVAGTADLRCMTAEGAVRIPRSTIGGDFYGGNLDADGFNASGGVFDNNLYMNGSNIHYNTVLKDTRVGEKGNFNRAILGSAFIEHSTFEDGLTFRDTVFDGGLWLKEVDAPFIELRGVELPKLFVDDLDRYTFHIDDSLTNETWIREVDGNYGVPELVSLTETERTFYEQLLDRPRFPVHRFDGCTFTYDDLKKDFVMSYHKPVFANLVKKGVIHRVDDEHYLARTDAR